MGSQITANVKKDAIAFKKFDISNSIGLIQKWQAERDSGGYVGTILMSKPCDCLSHNLLIAKLEAYGLDVGSLNFLLDYLSLKKNRTKVGSSYSKWFDIC